jgi:hypothetical protein
VVPFTGTVTPDPPSGPYYLDAIFSRVRAFAQEIESSKRWTARAERTESQGWRLTFLREARAGFDRATGILHAIRARVAELGPPDALPPPLDRIHDNLAAMETDLGAHAEALVRLEAREAEQRPLGSA